MKIENLKDIVLVYLNFSSFEYSQVSIGLASIYTFLKKNGINVKIVDTSVYTNLNEIIGQIKKINSTYIGISTTEMHYNIAITLAKHLKNKDNKIIIGGTFPSLFPADCLSSSYIDYACVGDGEYTLLRLLNGENISEIQGLWFKDNNEKIIKNGISAIFNINDFEITDYSGFPVKSICSGREFFGEKIELSFTWSSRGCMYNCTYCCNHELMSKSKIRYRDARNFYEEILFLKKEYKINDFFLSDENFLTNINHVNDIIKSYPNNIGQIRFGFLARPENINYKNIDLLRKLVKIGWSWVSIGIEFGDEIKRREKLNRKHSNEQIITAFKICRELGILTNAFLITGFYFETINDILITDKLLRSCNPDNVECSFFFPLKGSDLYKYYYSNNLIIKDSIPRSYFDTISIIHPNFSFEELNIIKNYWDNWNHNSNIKMIINYLANARNANKVYKSLGGKC